MRSRACQPTCSLTPLPLRPQHTHAGKTTFLRALAGGEIKGLPVGCQVLHVEQEVAGDDTPVIQVIGLRVLFWIWGGGRFFGLWGDLLALTAGYLLGAGGGGTRWWVMRHPSFRWEGGLRGSALLAAFY